MSSANGFRHPAVGFGLIGIVVILYFGWRAWPPERISGVDVAIDTPQGVLGHSLPNWSVAWFAGKDPVVLVRILFSRFF
jgi:hypothetical protein